MRNGAENQIELVLIRHGKTQSNSEHRYLGKTEENLSQKGRAELMKAIEQKQYPDAELVFSSPMQRCLETAKMIYPDKVIFQIPEWEEMDFGDFEGKNYIELQKDERYQKWIDSNGTMPFPNGESRDDFITRCKQGFERMLQNTSQKSIAAIVHGGTIMALLCSYFGGEYFDYQTANGDGYICRLDLSHEQLKITEIKRICEK